MGVNHTKLFCINNGTVDKFEFRKIVKLWGFGRKANRTSIFGVKQTVKVFLELNIKYENVDNLF